MKTSVRPAPTRRPRARTSARATVVAMLSAMLAVLMAGPAVARTNFPDRIGLPDGFLPEGIAIDRSGTAYFGSRADGDIYAADLRTGFGAVISQGRGTPAVGLKIDRRGLLFVAGGPSGTGRVVDSDTGETQTTYSFATGQTFVNDVVLARRMAWFTDSQQAQLYGVPLSRSGRPTRDPANVVRLPLRGEWRQVPGFNANGIETTPNRRSLLVVQSSTGLLFRVNPRTGVARTVDLGGYALTNGDGLLRKGRTLYVVQNQLNRVAVLHLNRSGSRGRLVTSVTDDDFDVPTTVAAYRDSLYLPNARFTSPQEPDTEFWVTRIDRPGVR